ncbi:hypothetical protein SPRG_10629 [Saprolegnia parasitica CBS 223.65]|uniref:Uncharacterized protein n=1 Tax=Saprolegnia parasitica (strain CBS 223.65) TaxID=695850 RepID=A0A067C519_SAPPC|nr:hypothetical protein SPRG_10629 [Saprolegnia parasitica CBS 223.65]KDO24200.1 hypothetical protein SPRG_10629 [Saprolegnia parasitica CBS 223.65]|eukprot:XP_012205144.1 hypothetical protein SPRG_10629 [Saprolegnia parasitica CBS 223.65]
MTTYVTMEPSARAELKSACALMSQWPEALKLPVLKTSRVKWARVEAMGGITKAFISLGQMGMFVLDVTVPEQPLVLAELFDGHGGMALKHFSMAKCIVYTACGKAGLRIFTNIDTNIDEIGALVHARYAAKCVAVQGDIALVTFGRAGVRTLDVANPSSPVELGGFKVDDHEARFVLLSDGWGYVSFGHAGVRVLDVTNAAEPAEIAALTHAAFDARHMALAGSLLFVAFSYGGLQVLNVANPCAPELLCSHTFPAYAAEHVVVRDSFVYVAIGAGGLRILRVHTRRTNEVELCLVGSYVAADVDVTSLDVTLDCIAFLCTRKAGLVILDVRDPGAITRIGHFSPPQFRHQSLCAYPCPVQ